MISLRILLTVALAWAPTLAAAQGTSSCDSCASCTQALAVDGADVKLSADLPLRDDGPCVLLRGTNARFDGAQHVLLAQPVGGVGVRVEGAGAVVRNLRITGATTGVAVAASHVTVYQVVTEARGVGIQVEAAPGLRLDHVRTLGGRVGVSFGALDDGACPSHAMMRSPGAVVLGSTFEGAAIGLAACDARPVLTGNTARGNGVGVVLGDPAASPMPHGDAPWDPCVCGNALDGLRPGQLAMFSSGCGGCTVHEGWMPSLRRRGVEVRVRENGRGTEAAQRRFDAWAWRCATGVMDALGIPGCVPNYTCPSTGLVSKRRRGDHELQIDAPIHHEDDVFALARRCAEASQGRYVPGPRCVVHALADNTFCANQTRDLRVLGDPARWGGARNRCRSVEGWLEGGHTGCSAACDDHPVALSSATPDAPPGGEVPAGPSAQAPPGTEAPLGSPRSGSTPRAPASPSHGGDGVWWVMGGFIAVLVAAGVLTRKRGVPPSAGPRAG